MNDLNLKNAAKPEVTVLQLSAVRGIIESARYPDPMDKLMATLGEGPEPLVPAHDELFDCGIELFVLDRELSHGLDPALFTRALRCGVLDVDAFNNSPFYRENRAEFYDAMLAVVERVESKLARRAKNRRNILVAKQERAAINRSLCFLNEAI